MNKAPLALGTKVWLNTQGQSLSLQNQQGSAQVICTDNATIAKRDQDYLYAISEIRSLPIEGSPTAYAIRMVSIYAAKESPQRETLWLSREQLSSLVPAVMTEVGQKLRALIDTTAMTACYSSSVRVSVRKGEILVCPDKYSCSAGRIVLTRNDGSQVTTGAVRSPGPSGQGVINPYIFEVVC